MRPKTKPINLIKSIVVQVGFPSIAIILVLLTMPEWEPRQHWHVLFFYSLLTIIASFAPIRTFNATLTLNNAVIISGLLLEGIWVSVWCALLESIILAFLFKAPNKTLSNVGQMLVTIVFVGYTKYWLDYFSIPWMISDILLIGVYLLANTFLCAILISYYVNLTWLDTTKSMLKGGTPTYILLMVFGGLGARLVESSGSFALLPIAVAFFIISMIFRQYYNVVNQLQKKVEEVKSFNHKFLTAMAASIDARDHYTSGHSQRVAHWGREIAVSIGLPEEKVEEVYFGGILHDIGKIGIEDEILNKEGKLTPEEYDKIKQHTVIGYEIMQQAGLFNELLPAIRSHHERIDGRGYPDGLRGEEIPLVARILAISDAFDAMVADRPYRKGLPIEKALQEIKQGAGTQFDEKLAKEFITIIDRLPKEELEAIIQRKDQPQMQEAFN